MEDKARIVVIKTLCDIDEKKSFSNIKLSEYFKKYDLNGMDRGFATEILYGTIRWKLKIDYIIQRFLKMKIGKLSPWVKNSIRIAVYQIMYMDKVPVYAAVNQSVEIVKRKERSAASLVNAVLRNIIRNKSNLNNIDIKNKVERLSVEYSHPIWFINKMLEHYNEDFVIDLMKINNTPPKLTVRINTLKTKKEELINILTDNDIVVEDGILKDSLYLENFHMIEKSNAFQSGLFIIQDESSMLAVKCLDPQPNERVMDLCSAPGGKATYMAQLMNNQGEIMAFDIYEHKINLINNNAERLGINIIKTQLKDSTIFMEDYIDYADKVLVDAPCSGLGLIRKKPEIRWNVDENVINELTSIQYRILENAARYVKKEGTLVYSTCTLTFEENEYLIKQFLASHENFKGESIEKYLPDNLNSDSCKEGFVKLFPNIHNIDGFFIAKFKRIW